MRGLLLGPGCEWDEGLVTQLDLTHLYLADAHRVPDRWRELQMSEKLKMYQYDAMTDFATVVGSQRAREHYVGSIVSIVNSRNLDGILLGWRAPGFDSETGTDTLVTISEGVRYSILLKELRQALPGKDLAICLPVNACHVRRILPILDEFKPHVNSFVLLGFDGAWLSSRATHASALFPTIDAAVQSYTKVLRPEKIFLAVPGWVTVFENCEGLTRPFGGTRIDGQDVRQGGAVIRDMDAGAMPVIEGGNEVFSFEDGRSLAAKKEFIESRGLGGAILGLAGEVDPPDDIYMLWESLPPPPVRTVSLKMNREQEEEEKQDQELEQEPISTDAGTSFRSVESPPPRPPFKCRRTSTVADVAHIVEWSPLDVYEKGDRVSIGKKEFICNRGHAPTFPTVRPDLWKEQEP